MARTHRGTFDPRPVGFEPTLFGEPDPLLAAHGCKDPPSLGVQLPLVACLSTDKSPLPPHFNPKGLDNNDSALLTNRLSPCQLGFPPVTTKLIRGSDFGGDGFS